MWLPECSWGCCNIARACCCVVAMMLLRGDHRVPSVFWGLLRHCEAIAMVFGGCQVIAKKLLWCFGGFQGIENISMLFQGFPRHCQAGLPGLWNKTSPNALKTIPITFLPQFSSPSGVFSIKNAFWDHFNLRRKKKGTAPLTSAVYITARYLAIDSQSNASNVLEGEKCKMVTKTQQFWGPENTIFCKRFF